MSATLFKTKAVKIDTLGEYLASVRKQLNYDVKTVSQMTQIRASYLESLEAGEYEKLPAEVYILGFLKSLANLYRVKEKILIDQYEKERGFDAGPTAAMEESSTRWSVTPRRLVVVTSVTVALAAAAYVGIQINSVLAPPFLEVSEPSSDISVMDSSIVVSGRGEVGAEIFLNNQQVLADANGEFTENISLSNGLNVIEVLEKNKFGKVSRVTRQVTAQIGGNTPVENASLTLAVTVGPDPAWVYMEADGVVVQRGTMLAGSEKIITAREQIILTSANAGSTTVVYNGKDLGKLGRPGEVIRNVEFSAPTQ
jgi:cytoskeletal protein RodZ